MPEMVRTAVLGGDTDSTLFTVWSWVLWYSGELTDSQENLSVAQTIIYLTSMMVKHYLAIVSGVMGVQKKRIHQMAMKNEFFFATFITTRRTKHYCAMATACEGLVYKEPDLEIKGVGLKNRKAPTEIIEKADEFMEWISETSFKKGKFKILPKLKEIAEIEYQICMGRRIILNRSLSKMPLFIKTRCVRTGRLIIFGKKSLRRSMDMFLHSRCRVYGLT